jgi:hypothetical protein
MPQTGRASRVAYLAKADAAREAASVLGLS